MNIPNTPRNIPSASPNTSQLPNQSNVGGGNFEQSPNTFSKSVQRSKVIKTATSSIVASRDDFVSYLKNNNLDLLTSAVIFQETGDFVISSYIIYPQSNNSKEPLVSFLERYPNLKEPVQKINESLRPLQSSLQIQSK